MCPFFAPAHRDMHSEIAQTCAKLREKIGQKNGHIYILSIAQFRAPGESRWVVVVLPTYSLRLARHGNTRATHRHHGWTTLPISLCLSRIHSTLYRFTQCHAMLRRVPRVATLSAYHTPTITPPPARILPSLTWCTDRTCSCIPPAYTVPIRAQRILCAVMSPGPSIALPIARRKTPPRGAVRGAASRVLTTRLLPLLGRTGSVASHLSTGPPLSA